MDFMTRAILIGIGATLLMDLWALLLQRAFGISSLDYTMVGRWLGHMPAGQFTHASIAQAGEIRGERFIGWTAHYGTGILFAGILLAACGPDWAREPTLAPALAAGILTVAAPFCIMQPGMGFGIAASRRPKANIARLRSLVTHTVFGLGLYVSAAILAQLMPR
jgi:hypothetical protein